MNPINFSGSQMFPLVSALGLMLGFNWNVMTVRWIVICFQTSTCHLVQPKGERSNLRWNQIIILYPPVRFLNWMQYDCECLLCVNRHCVCDACCFFFCFFFLCLLWFGRNPRLTSTGFLPELCLEKMCAHSSPLCARLLARRTLCQDSRLCGLRWVNRETLKTPMEVWVISRPLPRR